MKNVSQSATAGSPAVSKADKSNLQVGRRPSPSNQLLMTLKRWSSLIEALDVISCRRDSEICNAFPSLSAFSKTFSVVMYFIMLSVVNGRTIGDKFYSFMC